MKTPSIKVGNVYGRITVIDRDFDSKARRPKWVCQCECGNKKSIAGDNLTKGHTKSCGCIKAKHGMRKTPEFEAWHAMKGRCLNPKNPAFRYYGGRGITICEEWKNDFLAFYNHIGERPDSKLSIDRINNDGNYEPGNVRWATAKQQANNTRRSIKNRK